MKFRLDKTYLDCIDDAGNCFILYDAVIKLCFLKINYSAFIFSDQHNGLTERSSFHRNIIAKDDQQLSFSNKRFNISGIWKSAGEPVKSLLYEHTRGVVNWDCHHPLAHCHIDYHGRHFSGLGYAETLFLSVKPWDLPIDELRWGRFLAPGIAIVWIHWAGENPVNKIYLNGHEYHDTVHSTAAVVFNEGDCKLEFSAVFCIRQVKFSDHLAKIPLLKLFLNKAFLSSLESKYKAKTTFRDAHGVIHQGWSIFETIKWEH